MNKSFLDMMMGPRVPKVPTAENTILLNDRHLRSGPQPTFAELHWSHFNISNRTVREASFIIYTNPFGVQKYLKNVNA